MTHLTLFSRQEIVKLLSLNRATYYNWLDRRESGQLTDIKPIAKNPDRLLDWEKEAIRDYYLLHQENGYRRLTYMMIDQNVVYVSPSTVYRYLKSQGLLMHWAEQKSIGLRPEDPKAANEKWHTDLMILNIDGENYYYQGIMDAYSRYIIAWDIYSEGTAFNTSLVLQEAFDKSPEDIYPVIIADNGPEFIGREFRQVISHNNAIRVKIRPYHPQSNGIEERFHRTLRNECISRYENLIDAKRKVGMWIEYYNNQRLHSSLKYMPPAIWHNGNPEVLYKERKHKLEDARQERRLMNLRHAS
jgi:transposase InsO family protein